MTASPFIKVALPAALLAGTVFSALTVPLALLGGETIEVQFNNDTVYAGKLRDVAGGYIGLAAAAGLGAGFTVVCLAGWRRSTHKVDQAEQQLSLLQKSLADKERQVEQLMIASPQMSTEGLDFFLHEATASKPIARVASTIGSPLESARRLESAATKSAPEQSTMAFTQAQSAPSPSSRDRAGYHQISAPSAPRHHSETRYNAETLPHQSAATLPVSPMAAAQAYLSFSRGGAIPSGDVMALNSRQSGQELSHETTVNPNLQQQQVAVLQTQLQQIMSQIESLQNSLPMSPPVSNSAVVSHQSAVSVHNPTQQAFEQAVAGYAVGALSAPYRAPAKATWVVSRMAS